MVTIFHSFSSIQSGSSHSTSTFESRGPWFIQSDDKRREDSDEQNHDDETNDNEMKKYYFEGVTEDNIRKMFEIAKTVGICKIYTSYTATTSKGKLKPTGVLSFIRSDDISENEFNKLKNELAGIGIKISPYISDKGLKCTVHITNFYNAVPEEEDMEIENKGKAQVESLLNEIVKNKNDI